VADVAPARAPLVPQADSGPKRVLRLTSYLNINIKTNINSSDLFNCLRNTIGPSRRAPCMGNVASSTARAIPKTTLKHSHLLPNDLRIASRTELPTQKRPLRISSAPIRLTPPQVSKDLRSANVRQKVNARCFIALNLSPTSSVTSSTSQGWTFWDFKQPRGLTVRALVVSVDGGYLSNSSPREAAIGVWFGNGNAAFGSPHNISIRITAKAYTSGSAELIAATEALLKLYAIYSQHVREKDAHVVIKSDYMTMVERMNLYIATRRDARRVDRFGAQWKNLKQALELVESLGVVVGFWHVLRDNNRAADALASAALRGHARRLHLNPQWSNEAHSFATIPAKLRATVADSRAKVQSASAIARIRDWIAPL
jgi:ribonuclease HI